MSIPHEGPQIDGMPIGEHYTYRRRLAPESAKLLDLIRKLHRAQDETEKLRYLAYHDSLTGLPNARSFTEILDRTVSEAILGKERLGLALADIDGLKYANDKFGHDMGNQLIKTVASALEQRARGKDQVFRIGGDEFAVIMPGYEPMTLKGQTYEQLTQKFIKRYTDGVSEAIQELNLPLTHVGLSVGVALVDYDETPQDFFRRTDAVLRTNKPRKDDPRLGPIS